LIHINEWKFKGTIKALPLEAYGQSAYRHEEAAMKVKDVMHRGTTWVEPNTPVKEIAKRMRKDDVGAILVRADGQLVGIVTDRDITCRVLANSGDINMMTAKDVMTKKVVSCSSDDDIATAVKKMEAKKIRRLPVTNSHKGLVGMLSLGDISHKVSKQLSGEMLRALSAHHR
jgi:CBS domain-containing protein